MPVQVPPDALYFSPLRVFIDAFAQRVWWACIDAGGTCEGTSWWRSWEHNREVGGAPESQHLVALAGDVLTSRPQELAAAARSWGLVPVLSPGHVHVQLFPASVRIVRHLVGLGFGPVIGVRIRGSRIVPRAG